MQTRYQEIELPFWQDPQCHVLSEHQRDIATVFTRCWTDAAEPDVRRIGVIRFSGAVKLLLSRQTGGTFVDDPRFRSSILVAQDGSDIDDYVAARGKWETGWQPTRPLASYVVSSHDHQVLVIAEACRFEQVPVSRHRALAKRLEIG